MMIVENMKSNSGNAVTNQFIITEEGRGALGNFRTRRTFQSYNRRIAIIIVWDDAKKITLDQNYWDYSVTTGKYRNKFLNETKAETQKKINSGEYALENLNS